jgi:hypothetical protein
VIPTTSGTGSEATMVAVVSDTQRNVKLAFASYYLMPHAAILDPRMTQTLPPHLTAMTGMDALTHCVEAYTCLAANPLSDAYASAGIKKISENLFKVLDNPSDAQGRLEFSFKDALDEPMPEGFQPWFEFESKAAQTHQIIFGHWAALQGKSISSQIQNVDGGCVWGHQLIAYRLEDKEIFKVDNPVI